MEKILTELEKAFIVAQKENEFEFILTLINYKSISNPRESSNLYEWFDSLDFYKKLYSTHSENEKLRIGLLFYSTFFECNDFYNIIGNLCRNSKGLRGSSYLFWKTKKQDRLLGTGEKIKQILELLDEVGYKNISLFFETYHFEQIRNTFFHSNYSIYEGNYILFDSEPIKIDNKEFMRIPIDEILIPIIDKVILFFSEFKKLFQYSFFSYKDEKRINGFFPTLKEVDIHGTANGLKGITIYNTAHFYGKWENSGFYYDEKYNFWYGQNIVLNPIDKENAIIDETLSRYESKDDIRKDNTEFFNLYDKIIERNFQNERVRIINLLLKFGDKKFKTWEDEQNKNKKDSLTNLPLIFYNKFLEINQHINPDEVKRKVEHLKTNTATN